MITAAVRIVCPSALTPPVLYRDIKPRLDFYACYRWASDPSFIYKASHNVRAFLYVQAAADETSGRGETIWSASGVDRGEPAQNGPSPPS